MGADATAKAIQDLFNLLFDERVERVALQSLLLQKGVITQEALTTQANALRAIVEEYRDEKFDHARLEMLLARLRNFEGPPQ